VEWSPDGLRFAAGLSSKDVALCSFNEELQVWAAKKVGKYKAAATSLFWHPSNVYIATGSTDRMCHVYDVNEGAETFGQPLVTFDAGAWINCVTFSETGRYLACVPHDSTVRFKDLSLGPDAPPTRIRWKGLPFLRATFLGDSCLIACGFDKVPVLFRLSGAGAWQACGSVDVAPKAALASGGAVSQAKNMFLEKNKKAADTNTSVHTNTITSCRGAGGNQFSTSGLDGQVAVWELVA